MDLPMESSTITTTVLDVEDSQQDRDKNKASEGSAENNTFFEKDRVTGRSRGPGATSLPDLGGNGSCGWHALSYQIAQRSSGWSKSVGDIIYVVAKSLQAKVVHHLETVLGTR